MSRRETISRILVLIFVMSGLTDLSHGIIANGISKPNGEKREFRTGISTSLPAENFFGRSKSECEFEEESTESSKGFLAEVVIDAHRPTLVPLLHRENVLENFRTSCSSIFLLNRQFIL